MAGDDLKPIRYEASFISGKWPENSVHFLVESRMRVINAKLNTIEDYYQCASGKSENTFVEKDLFKEDNYDFLPVFGPEYGIIYRRKAYFTSDYKSCQLVVQMWEGQNYKLKKPKSFTVLESNEAIRKATNEGLPLVAHTEMVNEDTGLKAIMEYPITRLPLL